MFISAPNNRHYGKRALLITDTATPQTDETHIHDLLETNGWVCDYMEDTTITSCDDGESYDIIIIGPRSNDAGSMTHAFLETTRGVVHCGTRFEGQGLDIGSGFNTTGAQTETTINITDNTHPITDAYSTGSLTIMASTHDYCQHQGTSADYKELADNSGSGSAQSVLGYYDIGDSRVDRGVFRGRRVMTWLKSGGANKMNSTGDDLFLACCDWAAESRYLVSPDVGDGTLPYTEYTITASEDAQLTSNTGSGDNDGTSTTHLVSQGTDDKEMILKFDISSVTNSFSKATVRVYGSQTTGSGGVDVSIYGANGTWSEGTVTYSTAPVDDNTNSLDTQTITTAGYYEWDVTDYLSGRGSASTFTFKLKSDSASGNEATFNTSENGSNNPEIYIQEITDGLFSNFTLDYNTDQTDGLHNSMWDRIKTKDAGDPHTDVASYRDITKKISGNAVMRYDLNLNSGVTYRIECDQNNDGTEDVRNTIRPTGFGSTHWYAFKVMMMHGNTYETTNGDGEVVAQWYAVNPASPALALEIRYQRWHFKIQEGTIASQSPTWYDSGMTIENGQWYQIVVRANWSITDTGFYECWINGTKVLDLRGVDTVPTDHTDGCYFKFGPYHYDSVDQVTAGVTTRDEFFAEAVTMYEETNINKEQHRTLVSWTDIDLEKPTSPTGVSTSNITETGFDLSWTASTDDNAVTRYDIYIDDALDGSTTASPYSVTGLSSGTTYNYDIRALDASFNESDPATGSETTASSILTPNSDVSIATWTDEAAGTTNIYQSIDESTASDTDYISGNNNTNDTCEIGLSTITDPAQSTGHVISYRYRKDSAGGNARDLQVHLYQGATLIGSGTAHTGISDTWTDGTFTLSAGEADTITDYSDLRLRFTASGTTGGAGGNRRSVQVSWAQMEIQ